jgi:hypothetical protein
MYQPYPGSTEMPETSRPPAPAQSCKNGKNWARITGTVLFAIGTLDTFAGLGAPIAGPVKIWAILVWLVGLAAVVFLWRRTSSAFFKATPA